MMWNRKWWMWAWIALALCNTACVRQLNLHLQTGPCLNPPELYCDALGENSRVLEVHLYQLKAYIDPSSLKWDELVQQGKDLEILKPYLTDPEKTTVVKTTFTVQRSTIRELTIQRLKQTRYILAVTAGRHPGDHSIRIAPLGWAQPDETLAFEYYDVTFPAHVPSVFTPDADKGGP